MYQFFVKPEQIAENKVFITGSDVNHIRHVLRMSQGEQIRVCDGQGRELLCSIECFETNCVTASVLDSNQERTELCSRIHLYQGLPKSDKMELVIQKAVELGVFRVVPVITRRTIVKLEGKKEKARVERWNKIAESAAKQSQRSLVPRVGELVSFTQALDQVKGFQLCLIPYELEQGMEGTMQALNQVRADMDIAVFIGPEGGFEKEEISQAMEAGALPVSLGKRILRTETAGLAALSVLMFQLELCEAENAARQ